MPQPISGAVGTGEDIKMGICAGQRVKMNEEGLSQFPTYDGLAGELESYDRENLARVRFDGRNSAISIDPSFIEETDAPMIRNTSRRAVNSARYNALIGKRKLLHRAFMFVRKDQTQKELAEKFVAALAGRARITDDLLDEARQTIGIFADD